jgi:arsenate reductase (glutaredoxin)
MRNNDKTLTLYFNPDAHVASKTRAYAHTITDHVNEIDVTKTNITETQILELFTMIGPDTNPLDIVDVQSDVYKNEFEGKTFDTVNWAQILAKRPELIHYPIAVAGNRAVICKINQDINVLHNWESQERHK